MKRSKCEKCGGKIVRKIVSYDCFGEHIGKYPAEVCTKCGETVFDEHVSDQIEIVIKQKGLYGLASSSNKLKNVGSGFGICKGSRSFSRKDSVLQRHGARPS